MPRSRTKNKAQQGKSVEALRHEKARRTNLPSAEHQPLMADGERKPVQVTYERNRDLDPQLMWRGKDTRDLSDLVVNAPPLYIQERVHPKALVADLVHHSQNGNKSDDDSAGGYQTDMFADFNGLPEGADRTEFYQHDANWANRMILGDSLQVMASLSEREGLRGKVQCIYIDPPYGIRFNSNFQWSTTSNDSKESREYITREPEQVRAFRDTWRDGIHSYLTYLRDRLMVARDLLSESGSIFVQIGDENVHRVRVLLDEVFGENNFVSLINYTKTTGFSGRFLSSVSDYIVWYGKKVESLKYRHLYADKQAGDEGATKYRELRTIRAAKGNLHEATRLATSDQLTSQGASPNSEQRFHFRGRNWEPPFGLHWKTTVSGLSRLDKAARIIQEGNSIRYLRFLDDFAAVPRINVWSDIGGIQSRTDPKVYVVQTATEAVKRCILMTTDPGDLVLDPTCGAGTSANVAEQWGRRWITIDTSRVALALARARIMGARYPYFLLADSPDGQMKEAEVSRRAPSETPTYGNVRQGFVYLRVPHIMLGDIANNTEIDVIWDDHQKEMEPLREELNRTLDKSLEEWDIPRDVEEGWPEDAATLHALWWEKRIVRQKEVDKSIAAHAESEYLCDKPYEDNGKVRVAGPFTVESISPHRTLEVDEKGDTFDRMAEARGDYATGYDFAKVMLDNLKRSGVQQPHKEDRISFSSLTGWPGRLVCAEGKYMEGGSDDGDGEGLVGGVERRAAIFIGPEFGTVSRPDLVEAAREASDADFDVLIACAFNYDAHSTEFERLGRIPVLKARMNADLHMANDLKNTGNGNLFVIFGEPDIDILNAEDGQVQVRVNGVDVFHPNNGEVRSDGPDGIACWFIDTDYDQESFFVRHAYFLGAGDPYKSLKTTLKAEIDEEAWSSLFSTTSRSFLKPVSGRIAVKVINRLGDEVMKVFRVE